MAGEKLFGLTSSESATEWRKGDTLRIELKHYTGWGAIEGKLRLERTEKWRIPPIEPLSFLLWSLGVGWEKVTDLLDEEKPGHFSRCGLDVVELEVDGVVVMKFRGSYYPSACITHAGKVLEDRYLEIFKEFTPSYRYRPLSNLLEIFEGTLAERISRTEEERDRRLMGGRTIPH